MATTSPETSRPRPPWFTRGDLDGLFGLFVDNLLQLMLIVELGPLCGFSPEFVTARILPAAAVSILLGNLFYTWQARRLMRSSGRDDVTALPYGINTPALVAFIFFVMRPIHERTGDADLAWRCGLLACFLSGIIEMAGALVGGWVRRYTPRAALLSTLAGIAIAFIGLFFVFRLYAHPAIALPPALLILIVYAGRLRLPGRLPAGVAAIAVGTGLAWGLWMWDPAFFPETPAAFAPGLYLPLPALAEVVSVLFEPAGWRYLAVIVPMALFNVVGSLQNLESAEAAGDPYPTGSSLAVNGGGSMVAACLGSPFPTTLYIGHPAWKAMGARAGYSAVNGLLIAGLCLAGAVAGVQRVVPLEVTLGILLWIGITITAQAFEAVPRRHALAVAFGLVPALAAWSFEMVKNAVGAAGADPAAVAEGLRAQGVHLEGMIALNQGFLLTSMIYAAVLAHVVDRRFGAAAIWCLLAAALSMVGVIHAYTAWSPFGAMAEYGWAAAPGFGAGYLVAAAALLGFHLAGQSTGVPVDAVPGEHE